MSTLKFNIGDINASTDREGFQSCRQGCNKKRQNRLCKDTKGSTCRVKQKLGNKQKQKLYRAHTQTMYRLDCLLLLHGRTLCNIKQGKLVMSWYVCVSVCFSFFLLSWARSWKKQTNFATTRARITTLNMVFCVAIDHTYGWPCACAFCSCAQLHFAILHYNGYRALITPRVCARGKVIGSLSARKSLVGEI